MGNSRRLTGLLQQFQHVGIEENDDEPTGLAAMGLGVEDDGEAVKRELGQSRQKCRQSTGHENITIN
ncbi:uncharacterized protein N7500_009456 [Penicillium coprophilum]|uniref:uncharacterized protein n=1 Tax=Penicillium coprophilum TaxID=36646 RepID=UPI0023954FE4|nr:uncharacterized protein N7500_009456 [Penicillium coprophilum]KAJ5154017.1 hypothetical protein N7500_009456 [Penicillium coprophilum]